MVFDACRIPGETTNYASIRSNGVSTTQASAFLNEKLFTVVLEDGGNHSARGVRGVIGGRIEDLSHARIAKEQTD